MTVAAHVRPEAKLGTCPFCGQPLDKGAARQLAAALKREQQNRNAEIERIAKQRLAEEKEAMRQELEEDLASEKETQRLALEAEHAAEVAELERSETQLRYIVQQLKEQNEKLQRDLAKATPQQLGAVDEESLLKMLAAEFEEDKIQRNDTGHGADILHSVTYEGPGGRSSAGLIVYECKNTQTWLNEYVSQALKSRDKHRAEYAVLVSRAFPKKHSRPLFVLDNVIVVEPDRVLAVATLLRHLVIEIARVRSRNADETSEQSLRAYVTGTAFRQDIDFLYQSRTELDKLLAKEQSGHEKDWAARKRLYQDIAARVGRIDAEIEAITNA